MMRPRPDFNHDNLRSVDLRSYAVAVRHCFVHPLRRASHVWKDEHVCEECWQRFREIASAGF
jgi:hypothetical protein